jgi:hypothetical protein
LSITLSKHSIDSKYLPFEVSNSPLSRSSGTFTPWGGGRSLKILSLSFLIRECNARDYLNNDAQYRVWKMLRYEPKGIAEGFELPGSTAHYPPTLLFTIDYMSHQKTII